MSLRERTILVSGGSRGIGLAIALRAARDGANLVLAAKTDQPHPVLPGTIHTAAEQVRAAGGHALPVVCDVRDEAQIRFAVERAVATFGGIDAVVLNASALALKGTLELPTKRYDLMTQINQRGTFLMGKACLPHLIEADNPHILAISPPLEFAEHWWGNHLGWTMTKYAMSLCVRGWAQEFRADGVAANALWPRTTIATAATKMLGEEIFRHSREPAVMGDAAHWILSQDSRRCSGHFFIDEAVLRQHGVTDFEVYANDPTAPLYLDLLVDEPDGHHFREDHQ